MCKRKKKKRTKIDERERNSGEVEKSKQHLYQLLENGLKKKKKKEKKWAGWGCNGLEFTWCTGTALNRTVKDLCHQSSRRGPDRYVGFEFGVIETGLSLSWHFWLDLIVGTTALDLSTSFNRPRSSKRFLFCFLFGTRKLMSCSKRWNS